MSIRDGLIKAGIRNLKEFGYPSVDEENILSDIVFAPFFESMLRENKGVSLYHDVAIDELLEDIAAKREMQP